MRVPASFIAALAGAALILGACGSPAEQRTLTLGVPRDTGPLNIYSADSSFDYLVELVYDKLLAPSPYVDTPIPGLAERATALDATTWSVTLRDGVTWHDGTPFTAEDVKFTYES